MLGFARSRLFLLPLLALGGCSSLLTQSAGAGGGVGGAALANALTKNGAITAGAGLGAQAIAITGVQYLETRVHGAEQNAIAGAAGATALGGVAEWRVVHDIPIEANQHGEVTVTRLIMPELPGGAPVFDCKEIIFSVDTASRHRINRDFYTADVCLDAGQWKWATAEPATARWGALQ
jgi:hypothetical protein